MSKYVRATLVACAAAAFCQFTPVGALAQDAAIEPVAPLPIAPAPTSPTPAPSDATTPAPATPRPAPPNTPQTAEPTAPTPAAPTPAPAEAPVAQEPTLAPESPSSEPMAAPTPSSTPSNDRALEPIREAPNAEASYSRPSAYPRAITPGSEYMDNVPGAALPNRSMLTGGASLLLVSYVPAVIVAGVKERDGDHYLYYPVAGPWLYLARRDHDAGGKALLIIDGVAQNMGALHMLLSLVVPERTRTQRSYAQDQRVHVVPRVARQRDAAGNARGYLLGLQASGRF
jgi:hypothetical protein